MRKKMNFQPDDIESLLLSKKFDELGSDEKEFVLNHVDSEEEYESMRKMLRDILEQQDYSALPEPPASIKANLLAEFAQEKKGGFAIWLNSLFAMPEKPWYAQNGVKYGLVLAGMFAGAFLLFNLPNNTDQIAQLETKKEVKEAAQNPTMDNDSGATSSESIASAVPEVSSTPVQIDEITSAENTGAEISAPQPLAEKDLRYPIPDRSISAKEESTEDVALFSDELKKSESKSVDGFFSPSKSESDFDTNLSFEAEQMDQVIGNSTPMAPSSTRDEIETLSKVKSIQVKTKASSKAATKKDLIDLLYTAL